MNEVTRIVTNPRRGRAVVHNGTVYLGGAVAANLDVDVRGQMEQIVASIDAILAQAGTDKTGLLTVQIWLRDIARDFTVMNEVWDRWIEPEHAPARATAQCEMGAPDILVEVLATAALPV